MVNDAIAFFRERFGIAPSDVERLLGAAMSRGGDYADLYFEYTQSGSVLLEESIVKSATRSVRRTSSSTSNNRCTRRSRPGRQPTSWEAGRSG